MSPDHQPQNPLVTQALGDSSYKADDSFQRWVGISAWLLLVLYEEDRYDDEDFDDDHGSNGWGIWTQAERFEGAELREFLESEVFPALERLTGTGHPLASIPAALRGVPDGPLLSTLQRAKDCYEPSSVPPLGEVFPIWERWQNAALPILERGGGATSLTLALFLAKTICVKRGEKFCDLLARDGEIAGQVAKAATDMILFEPSPALAVIAAAQAILNGQPASRIKVYCGFPFHQQNTNGKLDVIVGIPPWGMMISHENRSKRSEYLFLEYVMDHLAEGGRAAVVMPHSFLFGGASRTLRKRLLETFRLDAVVNMPSKAVFPTSVKSAILYFTKAAPRDSVWMVSEEEYFGLVERGDYDSSEEESFIAALQALQGLAPFHEHQGMKLDFGDWIDHLMNDIESQENPEGMRADSLEYRMTRLAKAFHCNSNISTVIEESNLVPSAESLAGISSFCCHGKQHLNLIRSCPSRPISMG